MNSYLHIAATCLVTNFLMFVAQLETHMLCTNGWCTISRQSRMSSSLIKWHVIPPCLTQVYKITFTSFSHVCFSGIKAAMNRFLPTYQSTQRCQQGNATYKLQTANRNVSERPNLTFATSLFQQRRQGQICFRRLLPYPKISNSLGIRRHEKTLSSRANIRQQWQTIYSDCVQPCVIRNIIPARMPHSD